MGASGESDRQARLNRFGRKEKLYVTSAIAIIIVISIICIMTKMTNMIDMTAFEPKKEMTKKRLTTTTLVGLLTSCLV